LFLKRVYMVNKQLCIASLCRAPRLVTPATGRMQAGCCLCKFLPYGVIAIKGNCSMTRAHSGVAQCLVQPEPQNWGTSFHILLQLLVLAEDFWLRPARWKWLKTQTTWSTPTRTRLLATLKACVLPGQLLFLGLSWNMLFRIDACVGHESDLNIKDKRHFLLLWLAAAMACLLTRPVLNLPSVAKLC